LSHVHLQQGGHFISLLLIFFSAYSALLYMCMSLPLISIVCCQQSDMLYVQWAVRLRGEWFRQPLHKTENRFSQTPLYSAIFWTLFFL
jgi:hypothetical protein